MTGTPTQTIPEGTRNNTLTSIAGSMRYQGMTETQIQYQLSEINEERCSPPLAKREVSNIARSMMRYEPGKRPPRSGRASPREILPRYREHVVKLPEWRGPAGNRNLKVLLAVHDIGHDANSFEVSCSSRQLGGETGIRQSTVSKALRALTEVFGPAHHLDCITPGTGSQAPQYHIRVERELVKSD